MIHQPAMIDQSAAVSPSATVWEYAKVIRHATVGDESNIGSCAIVDCADVGRRCSIGHGAQLHPGTLLGDDVFVGPGVICCNDCWPRMHKEGFDGDALLDGRLTTVRIADGASVGAGAIILPGVVIGESAMVAAGSVVERSVPPWHLHKRSGEIAAIDRAREPQRMREALAA